MPNFLPSDVLPAEPCPSAPLRIPRVLAIAGSDPSGGAGIQADLKSIAANGGYGMAAITALTAQNTQGVRAVHVPPAAFLTAQLDAISDDIGIDAVKIGMLGDAAVIDAVRSWLEKVRPAVVVLDPVMVATSGDRLLQESAEAALQALLPLADLITPNLAELAILLKEPVAAEWAEALAQGKRLAAQTGTTVLVKGGHLQGGQPDADAATPTPGTAPTPAARTRWSTPEACWARRPWWCRGSGSPRATATAPAAPCPRPWPPCRPGWGTGKRRCGRSSRGCWARSAKPRSWTSAPATARSIISTTCRDSRAASAAQRGQGSHAGHGPAEGEFAAALRAGATADLDAIYGLEFIRGLADGTLPEHEFAYYLAQDAIYLNGYSRVLARAAAIAPTEAEQLFWARSAQTCLEVESELHRSWLSTRPTAPILGPVTKSYVDHLLAASVSGSYGVLVAAALPCFWLYAEVGATLHREFLAGGAPEAHPYADWLRTYADEDFAAATRQAIAYTDAAARRASESEREAMALAFRQSSRYEVDFFDAPRLHA